MPKKIIILGAGIGGLTVAHELVNCGKEKYDIHIFERNDSIGGMARSGYKNVNGKSLPTEYCWRIYGPNYDNLRDILKKIPLKNNPNKTVFNNLVDLNDYLIADQNTVLKMNNRPGTLLDIRKAFKNVPHEEKIQVLQKIFYGLMISTQRLNKLDRLSWQEYIDPENKLSHDMRKYTIDILAPFLGAEARKVNVPSVIRTYESFKLFNKPLSVMNGPTNEAWFDHWKSYLETNGVNFYLNTSIKDLEIESNAVKKIILEDGTQVSGDEFFCCLPVESAAALPSLNMPGISELAKRAYQLMVGIQLYFDKKINLPNKKTALYIPDSHWQLVIEPQGAIWEKNFDDIGDVWSIGICDPVREGHLTKKPFIKCNYEEIKNEVWHQIKMSEFGSFLNLDSVEVIDANLWDSYVYNGEEIKTYEPKFSTNKGTYFLRPENRTPYKNLYFATAYTKTQTDMFEMESAAESGKRAAKILEPKVRVFDCDRTIFFSLYNWVDAKFPKLDLYQKNPLLFFVLGIPVLIFILPFLYLRKIFTS